METLSDIFAVELVLLAIFAFVSVLNVHFEEDSVPYHICLWCFVLFVVDFVAIIITVIVYCIMNTFN